MRLHHWFIANSRNRFHPPILRPLGLMIVGALLVMLPLTYNLVQAKKVQVLGYATSISIPELVDLTNAQRASNGLSALTVNGALSNAAAAKASDMFAKDYWAHVSPSGATPWSFILAAGYSYATAGENLAKNFDTSSGVVTAWMNSPEHRANILNSAYKDVGFAVVNGTLLGEQTTLVVAMYASPYNTPAPAPIAQTQKTQPTSLAAPAPQPSVVATPTPPPSPMLETSTVTPPPHPQQSKAPQISTVSQPEAAHSSGTLGDVLGSMTAVPINHYASLNWGQKTSVFLLSATALLFTLKHTLIWRQQRRGIRQVWLRAHPLAQASLLVFAIIVTLSSGSGVIL